MFQHQPDERQDANKGGGDDPKTKVPLIAPEAGMRSEVIVAIITTMGLVAVAIIGRGDPELVPHIYCPGAEHALEPNEAGQAREGEAESAREALPEPEVGRAIPPERKEPHEKRSVLGGDRPAPLPSVPSCEEACRQQREPVLVGDEPDPHTLPIDAPSCEPPSHVPLPATAPLEPDAGPTGWFLDLDDDGDVVISTHVGLRVAVDTHYEYDGLGRLIARTMPSSELGTFRYDLNGNRVSAIELPSDLAFRFDLELARAPRERVLSLGIDYEWSSTVPTLTMAASDALEVANTLTEQGYEGDSLLDEEATLNGLLLRLRDEVSSSRPGDSFVLYFAGHGVSSPEGQRSVILPDDYGRLTAVPLDVLTAVLSRHRGHVSVILDGCATMVPNLPTHSIHSASEGPTSGKLVYFAATSLGQDAVEAPDLQGGLFTDVLVREMERRWEQDGTPFRMEEHRETLTDVAAVTAQLAFERYGVRQTPTAATWSTDAGTLVDVLEPDSSIDLLLNLRSSSERSPVRRLPLVFLDPNPERLASALPDP